MSFLTAVIAKNLARTLADKWSVAIWIGIPLLIGVLMTVVTGGATAPVGSTLVVVDKDRSPTSAILIEKLGSGEAGGVLSVAQMNGQAANELLDRGEISAVLIIPQGFETAFLGARPTRLQLLQNPLQPVGPELAAWAVQGIVDGAYYLQQGFGDQLAALGTLEPEARARKLGDLIDQLTALVAADTPAIEIVFDAGDKNGEPGIGLALFPGLLLMSLIFAAQGLGDEIWIEREAGTLRRLMSVPSPGVAFLAGRSVAAVLTFILVSLPLAGFGFFAFGLDLVRLPFTLLWLGLAGLVLLAIFTAIQVFSPNRRAGALYTIALMFPLLMAGGSFFPLASMPDFLAALGRLTPNGMMLEALDAYLGGASPFEAFGTALPLSLGILGVFTLLAVWRFNFRFSRA